MQSVSYLPAGAMQVGQPPTDAVIRQRLQIGVSSDPAELGTQYPRDSSQGMSMHFISSQPLLGVGYATKDNAWSVSDYKVDARNTISCHCSSRYRIGMKRLPDGTYEYDIRFDPIVAGARIDIGGKSYFVPSTPPPARAAVPRRGVSLPRGRSSSPGTTSPGVGAEHKAEVGEAAAAAPEAELPPSALKSLGETIKPIAKADTKVFTGSVIEFPQDSYVPRMNLGSLFGGDVVGDYHIPAAGERESATVKSVLNLAEGALPEATRNALNEIFSKKNLVEGSHELRELFRSTVAAINEQKAHESGLGEASEQLQSTLGLPKNTRVFLSLSGGRAMGLSEKDVSDALNHAFGDIIRIRGFRPKLVDDDDVVIFQAYTDDKGGPICLGMTTITGDMSDRKTWKVSSYDATFQGQPFLHVHNQVDRNPNAREEAFDKWARTKSTWLDQPAGSKEPSILETALREKESMIEVEAKKQKAQAERDAKRAEEVAKQSAVFARLSDQHFRMGYEGSTIDEHLNTQGSVSAVGPAKTGTYRVEADADIHFEIKDSAGSSRPLLLRSEAQLRALSEPDKKMLEYALSTPVEGKSEHSLRRVISLFPSDAYRPGWSASWFYSPRYFSQELLQAVKPAYEGLESSAEQRKFLQNLYGALTAEGSINEESIGRIQAKLAPAQ